MLNTSVTQQNNRWTKPSPHACTLKCCIDAAMFEEEKLYGFGICIWDNIGNFVGAKIQWQLGYMSASSWSWRLAWHYTQLYISWIKDMSLANVILEVDCKIKMIVDGLQSSKPNFWVWKNTWKIQKYPSFTSKANQIVYSLARASRL